MKFTETCLQDAWLIDLERHGDDRGFFARSFCEAEFGEHGLATSYPQCNISFNRSRGTLRGMHWQVAPHQEAKLVRCTAGAIWDVIADLRPESPSHLKWVGAELSAENRRALYVPVGFAHGFISLADSSEVFYQMSDSYAPGASRGFRYDDPTIAIDWPAEPQVISEADAGLPSLDPESWHV
jgi:dTDP-4-dehydrorhamnose 3,5-epimerase